MFTLKDYQQDALDSLRDYFITYAETRNPRTAFYEITRRNFDYELPYNTVRGLEAMPYLCIRIPTGGGKTVVACHAVRVAAENLLHADRTVVLWLVPSNTIRDQTLKALNDKQHPYRQALETTIGEVSVLDITQALNVSRATLNHTTTIIVSSIQTFRVGDTDLRKVYEGDGALLAHFKDIPQAALEGLETLEDGTVRKSLANLLRMRRPLVIVDEAHNARSPLSFETLARFNPSCIIEFTATPDKEKNPSNILHTVSAAELNDAEMIKLPIRLEARANWKELLADAIAMRAALEKVAQAEQRERGEYIRPIMLIQAQPRRANQETLTTTVVEQSLRDDFHIPKEQIVIATGDERGLDEIEDILAPTCAARFVITVQALREGWDCPFAYVLCSVAEMHAATAVEQLVGRILRLPRAARKSHPELNMAYAFATSPGLQNALKALEYALEQNGFERQEVKDLITRAQTPPGLPFEDGSLFAGTAQVPLPETPRTVHLSAETTAKVSFDSQAKTLTFKGVMSEPERDEIKTCFTTLEAKAAVDLAFRQSRGLPIREARTPSERGESFSVPALSIKQGAFFEMFEKTHFLDAPWSLIAADATLSETEYPTAREEGQLAQVTVTEKGRIESRYLDELHRQMALLNVDQGWTVAELVHWLDRNIPHVDISATESGIFLTRLVLGLIEGRALSVDQLALDKFRLKVAAKRKIDEHRDQALGANYQTFLLPDAATPLSVTPEIAFTFDDPQHYVYNRAYDGAYQFKKHFYPQVGDLKSQGEEFECAQFLDSLEEVKYWVRNTERRRASFWLQTSTDKFYPDFVCLLKDGRYLIVEYKGTYLWTNDDSVHKRQIGELWQARSNKSGLFIMPNGKDFAAIKTKINAG
ncbi:MAG TPA: DEAD/DEAH box helicase family protein [Pyrinomonadaceae bacterium]|jgi:type III restriction enzyme